jgi:rubredoxin
MTTEPVCPVHHTTDCDCESARVRRLVVNAGIGPLSAGRIAEIAALRGSKGRVVTPSEIDAMAFELLDARDAAVRGEGGSIPMRLNCPECRALHIDEDEFATKAHHTHACQHCGLVWRPAVVPTVGVRFLPGFKNNEDET